MQVHQAWGADCALFRWRMRGGLAQTLRANVIAVDGCRIRIPLLGWVRMLEPLRFNGAIKTATVSRIAIEDLNVKGMMSNHRLARHLADASFGEFKRQLLYKGAQRGVQVVEVDRWYPSSKTCSACGHLYQELKLSERSWTCAGCGTVHDRDKNAARNILAESIRSNTPGAGERACGA